jgi:acetoacetate decarboxylase
MFRFSEASNYLMPAHFGAKSEGQPRAATYPDVTSLLITYETDPAMLARYIPEGLELTQPVITIMYCMSRGVEWLGGSAYNLIAVNAPVAYPHGQERLEGLYALVLWENKTDPILTGREQTGMPKIFADIQDLHQLGERLFTNTSDEGSAFLRMDIRKTQAMAPEELRTLNQQWASLNWFGWRYIPNIGRPGAALSHATLFPQEVAFTQAWRAEGRVQWEAPLPEQHPTQAYIIRALSQLPIQAYRDCWTAQGSQVLRNDLARQLP